VGDRWDGLEGAACDDHGEAQCVSARLCHLSSTSGKDREAAGPWDLVFVDPPYEMDSALLDRTLAPLFSPGTLNPQALVVVERSKRCLPPVWPGGLDDDWRRDYGETSLYFAATKPAGES